LRKIKAWTNHKKTVISNQTQKSRQRSQNLWRL